MPSPLPDPRPSPIDVPEETILRIRSRVRDFRWEAWSEPTDAGDWTHGPPAAFMRALCRYWVDGYEWRAQERRFNALPHHATTIDGIDLHYLHEEGSGAWPLPLLICHGWPYSSHSYTGLVSSLAHPERHGGRLEDAFSVVAPSFPGYDFSARPPEPMGPLAIGLMFDKLMGRLGHDRYLVHGGDWGAQIASPLGFHKPGRVAGIHSTALFVRHAGAAHPGGEAPPDASPEEKAFIADERAIWLREGAYAQLLADRPAKLGYAMFDSPAGTAAWIVEAFHAWSDRGARRFEEIFSLDDLLNEVMLYLVTDAFPSAAWIYGAKRQEAQALPPGRRVEVPTALAAFRDPVFPMPPRAMAERSHDVVRYTVMPRGGHFPFYEAPDLLVDDLRAFKASLAA